MLTCFNMLVCCGLVSPIVPQHQDSVYHVGKFVTGYLQDTSRCSGFLLGEIATLKKKKVRKTTVMYIPVTDGNGHIVGTMTQGMQEYMSERPDLKAFGWFRKDSVVEAHATDLVNTFQQKLMVDIDPCVFLLFWGQSWGAPLLQAEPGGCSFRAGGHASLHQ